MSGTERFGSLSYGMVGGGPGAFIGEVHRKAVALDGLATLVAGAFSADPARSRSHGAALGLDPDRAYGDYAEMAEREAARPDGIDFVVIVTPNHLHAPIARAFLSRGVHVVCDKPLALTSGECEELESLAKAKGLAFCVTYTYAGYPAVKQARAMVAAGAVGELRFVNAEYPQEFFARAVEREGHKQAAWRFDPARAGSAGTLGDVGTHVENVVAYVSGLRLSRVCARLETLVPGRALDDNDVVMTEYRGGVKGLYWASQAAPGEGNGLSFRIYGSEGSISWRQEDPERLRIARLGLPGQTWIRGRDEADPSVLPFSRLPAGHPEGFFEALANLYLAFATSLAKREAGIEPSAADLDYPGVEAGTAGLRFVEACVRSSRAGAAWIEL